MFLQTDKDYYRVVIGNRSQSVETAL